MKNIFFLIFLLFFALSCKKEQAELAELNVNCATSKTVSANFTMTEVGAGVGQLDQDWNSETDSIWAGNTIWFYAEEDDADYTWYIGAEVIHERGFYRVFPDEFIGQTLPMTLVVNKKPNAICNPLDDGYDSIVRTLSVVYEPNYFNEPIHYEGNYRLKKDNSSDSIDIEIELRFYNENNGGIPFFPWDSFVVRNLEECDEIHGRIIGKTTYRKIWLQNNWHGAKEKCPAVRGFDYHKQMGGIVHISGYTTDLVQFNYYGRKLN